MLIKKRFLKCPGSILELISLKQDQNVDPLAVFEDELRKVELPLHFGTKFKALYDAYQHDENVFVGIRQIWNENCEFIFGESF